MEKAYDYIVADYAGNKVKVNGEEYKVGACCVDLLNSFNGPEEEKEFENLHTRIVKGSEPVGDTDVFIDEIEEIKKE